MAHQSDTTTLWSSAEEGDLYPPFLQVTRVLFYCCPGSSSYGFLIVCKSRNPHVEGSIYLNEASDTNFGDRSMGGAKESAS